MSSLALGFRLQFTVTVNRVQLIGNLGRDPEVRTTQSGGRVVTLSIATSGKLEGRPQRRASRTHRVAPRGDLQRRPRQDRRALSWRKARKSTWKAS